MSWNGLSTSSAAVIGNIPYFSGVNTFANVATGTLSATSPVAVSGGGFVVGANTTIACATCFIGTYNWNKQTTYNALSLTPTTTIPIWAKGAIYASSTLTVDGHITNRQNTAPSITNCGVGGSSVGSDGAGKITVGSSIGQRSCLLTFTTAWDVAPACTVTSSGLAGAANSIFATTTTSQLSILGSGAINNNVLMYVCLGY